MTPAWIRRPVANAGSACLLIALAVGPAMAGKNQDGALVVHTEDAVSYTYTGQYCTTNFADPGNCESARTMTMKEAQPAVIWLLAAFPSTSDPGVTVIYFGIEHNLAAEHFENSNFCGPAGSVEIPDDGWPSEGRGNSLAFGTPILGDTLFPFYWFAAYGFPGAFLGTGINPTGGYAAFVDDSQPGVLDPIEAFGRVRWFQPGYNECPLGPPATPTDLTAQALGTGSILLQWVDHSTRELGFEIERRLGDGGVWSLVHTNPADQTSWEDLDVTEGQTYFYRVRAQNQYGHSGYSNTAYATPAEIPAAPTDLAAVAVSPVGIDVTWTDHATQEIGFHLERRIEPDGEWTRITPNPGANLEAYQDRGLTPATTYAYRIRAYSQWAVSEWSPLAVETTDPAPPPQDAEVLVRLGVQPIPGALVLVDSGTGFQERGTTGATGTLLVADLNLGDRIRAVKKLADMPAVKAGHEAVGGVMWELWADSDRIQTSGQYVPYTVASELGTHLLDLIHPVFRYNLVVCVDWDLGPSDPYWTSLEQGLHSASSYLYNLSDGQIALGDVAVYDNSVRRTSADVLVRPLGDPQATVDGIFHERIGSWAAARLAMPGEIDQQGPNHPIWFRALARGLGGYALGLYSESANGGGLAVQWDRYREEHPQECPSNYGFMDDAPTTTEMSSANDYLLDYPAPLDRTRVTMQYYERRRSCWDWVEGRLEEFYPGIQVTKPPVGWYPDNVTQDRLGPTDAIGLLGDLTRLDQHLRGIPGPSIERFDTGSGSSSLRLVVLADGRPAAGAIVVKPAGAGPLSLGSTSADGSLRLLGLTDGDRIRVYLRHRGAALRKEVSFTAVEPTEGYLEVEMAERAGEHPLIFGRSDARGPGIVVDARPAPPAESPTVFLDLWPDEPLLGLPTVVCTYGATVEPLVVTEVPGEGRYRASVTIDVSDELFDGDGVFEIAATDTAGNPSLCAAAFSLGEAAAGEARDLRNGPAWLHVKGADITVDQLTAITWCNAPAHLPPGFVPIPVTDHFPVHLSQDDGFPSGAGLNITYQDQMLSGVDETSLALLRWDPAGRSWSAVDSSEVSTALNQVSAPVHQGGVYGVFATAASADTIPPSPVRDLGGAGVPKGEGHVDLDWAAPGDDMMAGRATDYLLAYSELPHTEQDWPILPKFTSLGAPANAGEQEFATVVLPEGGRQYYLSVRAKDEAGNLGPLSNLAVVVSGTADANLLPAPPGNLRAVDTPGDAGGSISLTWDRSADDGGGKGTVLLYRIYRSTMPSGGSTVIDSRPAGTTSYQDVTAVSGTMYKYWVTAADSVQQVPSAENMAFAVRNLGVPVGDFSSDAIVGIDDMSRFVDTYGIEASDPEFDPLFDLDGDDQIYLSDFGVFSSHFADGGIPTSDPAGKNGGARTYFRTIRGAGATFYLNVWIREIQDLAGYSFLVSFPPGSLTLLGATPDSLGLGNNVLNGNGGLTPLFMVTQPGSDRIRVANAIKAPSAMACPEGGGFLAQLTLQGSFSTPIALTDIVLMDDARHLNDHDSGIVVSVQDDQREKGPWLYASRPNPFGKSTVVAFQIPTKARVALRVYDVRGRRVATMTDREWEAGLHAVVWDGRCNGAHMAPAGIYFCRMESGAFRMTRRMVILR